MVQNQHLAILARGLGLDKYMLYAHGNDLCHDAELRHAMANCFEAVMGAIFLDQVKVRLSHTPQRRTTFLFCI